MNIIRQERKINRFITRTFIVFVVMLMTAMTLMPLGTGAFAYAGEGDQQTQDITDQREQVVPEDIDATEDEAIEDSTNSQMAIEAQGETKTEYDEEQAYAEEFSGLTYEGGQYNVALDYGEAAAIPEGTTLTAKEIAAKTKSYKQYSAKALQAVQKNAGKTKIDRLAFAKFYDITLTDEDGNEVEPSAPVDVNIQFDRTLAKELVAKDASNLSVIHFVKDADGAVKAQVLGTDQDKNNNGVAVVDPKSGEGEYLSESKGGDYPVELGISNDQLREVTFTADSFSVYAVVYTVDFHYGDGEYDFSIEGESSILLSDVFARLKIDDVDIADVEDVAFSDESLVKVEKVNRIFRDDDWKLTSLKPFDTEEALTVAMNDGSVIAIRVTDDKVAESDLSNIYSSTISLSRPITTFEGKEELDRNNFCGVNNDSNSTSSMIWKNSRINGNNLEITLDFFQKQNAPLDFIMVIDGTASTGGTVVRPIKRYHYIVAAALQAEEAILSASKPTSEGGLGYNNQLAMVVMSNGSYTDSGFYNYNTKNQAKNWLLDQEYGEGGTNHTRGINGALKYVAQSRDAGRTPIVVYISDFEEDGHLGDRITYYDSNGNAVESGPASTILNKYAATYAIRVFALNSAANNRHLSKFLYGTDAYYNNLEGEERLGDVRDDPDNLPTVFETIIDRAIGYVDPELKITDTLSGPVAIQATSNGITSSGVGSDAVRLSGDDVIWDLKNGSSKLRSAQLYTKTITIPLTDTAWSNNAYSGSLPTNGNCIVGNSAETFNTIDGSPLLKKDFTIITRCDKNNTLVKSASFMLKDSSGTELWSGSADASTGRVSIPWAENDSTGYAAFKPGSTYTLIQTATDGTHLTPTGKFFIIKITQIIKNYQTIDTFIDG